MAEMSLPHTCSVNYIPITNKTHTKLGSVAYLFKNESLFVKLNTFKVEFLGSQDFIFYF